VRLLAPARPADSRILADVLREQTLPPRASVLDLCSDSGILAITAARRGARSVTAVDRSRRAVLATRLNARAAGVRVRTLRGDLYEPIGDQRFDAIVCNPPREEDVLDRVVEEATDHLRAGGFLLLMASAALGTDRTLAAMRDAGLDGVECVARRRGALGPLTRSRVHTLEQNGSEGDGDGDVIVVRGRRPERRGWRPPTDAELAASG
jgi:release factor glutamine methyltransferase